MSPPRVSVMVPARNAAGTIGAALGSALDQEGVELDVIVVDDGSTDGTAERVMELDDPRVRVLRGPGEGVSKARNLVLDNVTGEWLALLDADDTWMPNRLERMIRAAEERHADLVVDDQVILSNGTRMSWLQSRGVSMDGPRWVDPVDFTRHRLGWAKPLARLDSLPSDIRFAEYIRKTGDFHFWYRVLLAAGRALVIPEPGYVHVRSGMSLSREEPDLWIQAVLGYADLLGRLELALTTRQRAALEENLADAWARYHRLNAQELWQSGRRGASMGYLVRRPSIAWERGRAVHNRTLARRRARR